jgi:predicted nucleic acid-binding protein
MTLVVDASVAVKWVVREERSEAAHQLIGRDALVAPALLLAEVGNALWRNVVAGVLPVAQAKAGIDELRFALDEVYPLEPLAARALELAVDLGHPVYDCFYVALAEALGAPLITADRRLITKLNGDLRRLVEVL